MAREQIECGEQIGVDLAILIQKLFPRKETRSPLAAGKQTEEMQRDLLQPDQNPVQLLRSELPHARQRRDIPPQLLHPVVADREAEILARDILDLMRFVEDYGVVVGENAAHFVPPHGEVGKEEMVVDDDDIGFRGALVHQGDKAALILLALRSRAEFGARVDLAPGSAVLGKSSNFRPVPRLRGQLPVANNLKVRDFFQPRKRGRILRVIDLLAAGVVAAALHVTDPQRPVENVFQKGNVAKEKLLLEGLGAGGNNHPALRQQRRHQIGECLPGSGPGFHDQFAFFEQGLLHLERHVELPAPRLESRMLRRKQAIRAEETLYRAPVLDGRSSHLLPVQHMSEAIIASSHVERNAVCRYRGTAECR